MTSTTAAAPEFRRASFQQSTHRLGFGRVLRSEWIKLTSVRSIGWAMATAVVLTAGVGLIATWGTLASMPAEAIDQGALAGIPIAGLGATGLLVSQLVFAIIGVIAVTGEYGSGQIRSTLTAVPTRLPVLAAKAIVVGVLAFLASAVALTVAMAGTIAIASGYDAIRDGALVLDASLPLAIVGGSAYLALLTVFSLGIGTLVRSGAGAIAIALGILLVLPTLTGVLPFDWVQEASPYLLPNAGLVVSMPGVEPTGDFWRALAVTVAWPAITLAGAAAALARRDA